MEHTVIRVDFFVSVLQVYVVVMSILSTVGLLRIMRYICNTRDEATQILGACIGFIAWVALVCSGIWMLSAGWILP